MVTQSCECTKGYLIVDFKIVNCMSYDFQVNKNKKRSLVSKRPERDSTGNAGDLGRRPVGHKGG